MNFEGRGLGRWLGRWLVKIIAVLGTFEYGLNYYDIHPIRNPILDIAVSLCVWITIWGLLNVAEGL